MVERARPKQCPKSTIALFLSNTHLRRSYLLLYILPQFAPHLRVYIQAYRTSLTQSLSMLQMNCFIRRCNRTSSTWVESSVSYLTIHFLLLTSSGDLYDFGSHDFWFTVRLSIVCGGRFQFDSFASYSTLKMRWHEESIWIKHNTINVSDSRDCISVQPWGTLCSAKNIRSRNQEHKSWLSINNRPKSWTTNNVIFTDRNIPVQARTSSKDGWQVEEIYSDIATWFN